MSRTVSLTLIAAAVAVCSPSLATTERPPVRTERGTCIPGPHHPLRDRRLPGTPAMSDRHPEPNDDAFVHCSEPVPKPKPARRSKPQAEKSR